MGAHYEMLDRLGGRLSGLAGLSCEDMPDAPTSGDSYGDNFDVFSDLIAAAFSCDITRVVSLSLGEMPTADFGWDHFTDDIHKGIAHGVYDSEDKHQAMTDYLTLHAEQVARLVSTLEATPDTDGRSVMDNTLIVWGSELANGWHGYQHHCPMIIGGEGISVLDGTSTGPMRLEGDCWCQRASTPLEQARWACLTSTYW